MINFGEGSHSCCYSSCDRGKTESTLSLKTKPRVWQKEVFGSVLKVREIIPFPVWIIQFPVLKIDFQSLWSNKKHLLKEVFWSEA